jgi:excisionase family DNA binding protein
MSHQENLAPRRRLANFKAGLEYLGTGRTRAYELIAAGSITAVKLGHKTMLDLDSIDRFHNSLPAAVSKAVDRRVR